MSHKFESRYPFWEVHPGEACQACGQTFSHPDHFETYMLNPTVSEKEKNKGPRIRLTNGKLP